jgi:GNAT superfamily N-acetyltransferase
MRLHYLRLSDPTAAPLLAGLGQEYQERYGSDAALADTETHEFDGPNGAFVVLLDGAGPAERTVAGGGIRRQDDQVCEVKRMWTAPDHRRQGHAKRVLDALRDKAVELGYRRIWLETGPAQPEALALYRDLGYRPIPVYGRYPTALAFEHDLGAVEPPQAPAGSGPGPVREPGQAP